MADKITNLVPLDGDTESSSNGTAGTITGLQPLDADASTTSTHTKEVEPGLLDTAEQYWAGQKGVYGALGRLGTAIPSTVRSAYRAAVNPPTEQEKEDVPYVPELEESPDPTASGLGRAFMAGKRLLYDPSKAAADELDQRALRETAKGHPQGLASHVFEHAAASVPVVGPLAIDLAERDQDKGDVSGALTEGLGYALAPKFAEEAAPVVAEAAKDTAAKGIRGAGKAINATKAAAPYVVPLAGMAEGYVHGGPVGAGIGALSGGTAGRFLKAIPDVPESVTRYGLPKIEPDVVHGSEQFAPKNLPEQIPSVAETNEPSPLGVIPTRETVTGPDQFDQSNLRPQTLWVNHEVAPHEDLIPAKTAPKASALGDALRPESTEPPAPRPTPKTNVANEEVVPSESEPKPSVDDTKGRNLRHVLGDYVVDELSKTKEGIAAAQKLSNGTYRDYADLASYEGVLKPKSLAEKTGKEWAPEDFKRTTAQHGKELAPNKELVLRFLVDSYGPQEIMQRTEGWGRAPAPEEPIAPEFSPQTEKLVKALGVSDEGKAALSKMNLGDDELQKFLIKLDTKDLGGLAAGKLPRRRIRK